MFKDDLSIKIDLTIFDLTIRCMEKIVMWIVCVICMKSFLWLTVDKETFFLSCWLKYWTMNSWQSGNNFQETQTFKIQIFGLLMFIHIYIVLNNLQPCTFSVKTVIFWNKTFITLAENFEIEVCYFYLQDFLILIQYVYIIFELNYFLFHLQWKKEHLEKNMFMWFNCGLIMRRVPLFNFPSFLVA